MLRAEQIDNGDLMDYSEVAQEIGYHWPVAVTARLEEKLLTTLPPGLKLKPQDEGMAAAIHLLLRTAGVVMKAAAEQSAAVAASNSFAFDFAPPWKDSVAVKVRITIGPDDDEDPCFTLDVAD